MLNARIRPQMSFAPALLAAIESPGTDRLAKAIVKELGPLAAPMVQRWKAMPNARKTRRYFLRHPQPWLHDTSLDLRGRVAAFAGAYAAAQTSLAQARKKVLQTEYKRYVQAGPSAYQPSASLAADAVLFADFQRYLGAKFGTNGCRCEKPGEAEPPPPTPRPKHGVLTQKLKCFDQCEMGHDEIYLVCVAVDGKGQYIQSVSPTLSIDDDSDDVLYPRHWIYPMQDTNGYLDVAVQMMEDDGGYGDIANGFKAAGGVVSTIGGAVANPAVLVAGAALSILGTMIDLIGDLDDDDDYGTQTKTWGSATALAAAAGAYVLPYAGEDWSGDSFDFDLTLSVQMS